MRKKNYGELHHKATLTDLQVSKIKRMYRPKVVGYRVLAQEFGVSQWTIRDYIKGYTRVNT